MQKKLQKKVSEEILPEIKRLEKSNFKVIGVIGIKNSPTCGISTTKNRRTKLKDMGEFLKK